MADHATRAKRQANTDLCYGMCPYNQITWKIQTQQVVFDNFYEYECFNLPTDNYIAMFFCLILYTVLNLYRKRKALLHPIQYVNCIKPIFQNINIPHWECEDIMKMKDRE